jgi:REP element-mobilizing transposase RayT
MNEEFNQFPTSESDDEKQEKEFSEFPAEMPEDETLDFASLAELPDINAEQKPVDEQTPEALAASLADEFEETPLTDTPEDQFAAEEPPPQQEEQLSGDDTNLLPLDIAALPVAEEQDDVDRWLFERIEQELYQGVLIMKGSRVWKYAGDLSPADIREIEHIIGETKNTHAIDMARYARLGGNQQKYLLYTTSISGTLILCTINNARDQLGKIRAQTRESAAQLQLDETQIVLPEAESSLEDGQPPTEPAIKLETGEAPRIMLDDILAESLYAAQDEKHFTESDGWVFEQFDRPDAPPETFDPLGGIPPDSNLPDGQSTVEQEAVGQSVKNFRKPDFPGLIKSAAILSAEALADKYSDWKPAYADILAGRRARLKNQKPPFRAIDKPVDTRPAPAEEPAETLAEEAWPPAEAEDDVVFFDENSDFLKGFTPDSIGDDALKGIDHDQDAGDFFEDYFNRSAEIIDEPQTEETPAADSASLPVDQDPGLEPAADPASDTAAQADSLTENAPLPDEIPGRSTGLETVNALANEIFAAGEAIEDGAEPPQGDEPPADEAGGEADLPAGETAVQTPSPSAESVFLKPEDFPPINAAADFQPPETLAPSGIDGDYNQMLISMQERFAGEQPAPLEPEKPVEPAWMALRQPETPASQAAEPPAEEDSAPEEQPEMDLHAIISQALTGVEEPAADANVPAASEPAPVSEDDLNDIFKEDLFPWEETGGKDRLEITPTPAVWTSTPGEGLVDLLSETPLSPVRLNFDQPMYTCILVPELSEFLLNDEIAIKIREWLPRLARVFGWQFDNMVIQPTYLQWTVRVPVGTSQGSIVRKVRQQTSLRIFETFPEMKKLSPDGSFWAKGYLVVAGGNPPPTEFLDDFIQKNRKPPAI